jgi:CubicO group peptidase (beta-lactamase class C family)
VIGGLRPAVILAQTADQESEAGAAQEPGWTVEERMRHYAVPGVQIATMRRGRFAWSQAWGEAAEGERLTPRHWFPVEELSPVATSLAVLRLVDRGDLDFDADLRQNESLDLAALRRLAHAITLRQVLRQTSGLQPAEPLGVKADTLLEEMTLAQLPGSSWQRSEMNWAVAQRLLSNWAPSGDGGVTEGRRVGADFASAVNALVVEPLEERQGSEISIAYGEAPKNAPRVRRRGEGGGEDPVVEVQPLAARGLWATAEGLARLLAGLSSSPPEEASDSEVAPPFLSSELLAEVTQTGLGSWGVGFELGTEASWIGLRSASGLAICHQQSGDVLVVLTHGGRGAELASEILLAVAAEFRWRGVEPEVLVPRELSAVAALGMVGVYRFESAAGEPAPEVSLVWRNARLHLETAEGFFPWEGPTSTELFQVRGGLRMLERPGKINMSLGGDGIWEMRIGPRRGRKVGASASPIGGEAEGIASARSLEDPLQGH